MENDWITGSVAIITGGASGIGKGIALEAAKNGAKVVIADLNEVQGIATIKEIEGFGGSGVFVKTDVTNQKEISLMLSRACQLGKVKYLANSAGKSFIGNIDSTAVEEWDCCLNVNLKSMFLVCRKVLPEIRRNGGGSIVNISSIQGYRCEKNVLAYSTSKGAVIAFTRSLGIDNIADGISVNCVCPGSVDTPGLRRGAKLFGNEEEVIEEWAKNHPIGRVGTPLEIAKTVMFLWSPQSDFIVGQSVIVDGGLGSIV